MFQGEKDIYDEKFTNFRNSRIFKEMLENICQTTRYEAHDNSNMRI